MGETGFSPTEIGKLILTRILVGLDGSESAQRALQRALALARLGGAPVHVLAVEEHLPRMAATGGEVEDEQTYENQYVRQAHEATLAPAPACGVEVAHEIVPGHAAHVITARARRLLRSHRARTHGLLPGAALSAGFDCRSGVEHANGAVLVVR
jgi:nucleotide-binding universal stress UspA family protein